MRERESKISGGGELLPRLVEQLVEQLHDDDEDWEELSPRLAWMVTWLSNCMMIQNTIYTIQSQTKIYTITNTNMNESMGLQPPHLFISINKTNTNTKYINRHI